MDIFGENMPSFKMKNNSAGFTLVEVIVAVALTFIVVDLGWYLLGAANRHMLEWRQKQRLLRAVHLISERFYRDMLLSKKVAGISQNYLVLDFGQDRIVRYEYTGEYLKRNQLLICPASVLIPEARFQVHQGLAESGENFILPDTTFTQLSLADIKCVSFYLTAGCGEFTENLTVTACLRHPGIAGPVHNNPRSENEGNGQ